MKITTFLIADKVIQNTSTRKTNIEGIFDTINATKFPAAHKEFFTFTVFEGENKKYNYKVSIEYNSKELVKYESAVDKKIGWEHSVITRLENIPFPGPGEYIVKVNLDNQNAQRKILLKKQTK